MKRIENRQFSLFALLAVVMLLSMPITQVRAASGNPDEIIALAKAQWAAENQMKPTSEAWTSIADDYTEFNPQLPTRIDGKAMAAKFYDAVNDSGEVGVVSEMQNPKVQFYGDTAILTYNYAGMTKTHDGKLRADLSKSTRVYVKQHGRWMLVHANFAPVTTAAN